MFLANSLDASATDDFLRQAELVKANMVQIRTAITSASRREHSLSEIEDRVRDVPPNGLSILLNLMSGMRNAT